MRIVVSMRHLHPTRLLKMARTQIQQLLNRETCASVHHTAQPDLMGCPSSLRASSKAFCQLLDVPAASIHCRNTPLSARRWIEADARSPENLQHFKNLLFVTLTEVHHPNINLCSRRSKYPACVILARRAARRAHDWQPPRSAWIRNSSGVPRAARRLHVELVSNQVAHAAPTSMARSVINERRPAILARVSLLSLLSASVPTESGSKRTRHNASRTREETYQC